MNEHQPYPREKTFEYKAERFKNKELIEDMLKKRDVLDKVNAIYINATNHAKKYIDINTPKKEYDEAFKKVLDEMEAPEPFDD